ncbi:hypothetical protein [Amycolatopsis sp. H20-H5]|uniref:hypothetical protein n=1 Tax=Amycolatopsis sp. H20-H5 TaxID=3046309 RepID=UPI002DB7120A|nr:hypothetical protein [Amycolatopsis sp. H20-H5]MEC3979013.1 hypothetical protein [Amycolatopsis sp. H20-H5]
MHKHVLVFTGVAASILVLASCSAQKKGLPSAAPSSVGAPTTEVAASTSAAPSSTGSAGGDFTKQGSKLKFGEKATVPFKWVKETGVVGITVKAIEKGAEADLALLKLGDKAKGMTPYYIRMVISNESGASFAYSSLSGVDGTLADGSQAQQVSVIGKFKKCDNGNADKDFTTKGASYETCGLALASPGAEVIGAQYDSGSYSDEAPNTDYSAEKLTWKP